MSWEFSGLGGVHAERQEEGNSIFDVGNLPEFKTDLEPGEVFLVPPAFVGCYAGDVDEGSYRLHRFVLEKLRPPCPPGMSRTPSWLTTCISMRAESRPRKPMSCAAPRRAANWASRPSCPTPCGFPNPAIGAGTRNGSRAASGRSRNTSTSPA